MQRVFLAWPAAAALLLAAAAALLPLSAAPAAAHSALLGATLSLDAPAVPGRPAELTVSIQDPYGNPVPAAVTLFPTGPGGQPMAPVPLTPAGETGRFRGAFAPDRAGRWSLELVAEVQGARWQGQVEAATGEPLQHRVTALYPVEQGRGHPVRDQAIWWEFGALLLAAGWLRWRGRRKH